MSRVEQPTTNLWSAVTENEEMVYPEAEIHAGAVTRGPRAHVPFSPEAVNPPNPQQGAIPMGHMMDTEEAHLTEMPRSLNTVVKAQVLIGGQPFESILDIGASDSAISMDVLRRLGLLDKMTPNDLTFLTAGGSSERFEGVLLALPIRIGRLDTMVTPAQNYNILVGNDWLCMAGADLLLSKSILRIRLGAEQWEDVPIDAEMIQRRLNTFLRRVSSTSQTP